MKIPWRNGKLDIDELANAIETQAEQIDEEWKELDGLKGRRWLSASQRHTQISCMGILREVF